MLSAASASIVTATLPLVISHGEQITGNFYQRMFDAHPNLLNLFNRSNQATGEQRQALAGAVVAYAEHLTGAGTLPWGPVLERIAHKHVSLGITPAQYTIVGKHLIDAVGEVLAPAVTPEIAAAWDEVYWLFACELIARESRLYHAAGIEDPAAIWRTWQVTDRITETPDVLSLILSPADGGPVPAFVPGQYVAVAVDLDGDRGQQIRQYTLSGPPDASTWQITVKRLHGDATGPAGIVSGHLHDRVAVGDTLRLSPPCGDVSSVAGDGPLVLISAGIGLTPAMAALEHLAVHTPDRPVVLVHADRADHAHALRQHLPRLARELPNLELKLWYEDPVATAGPIVASLGRIDPEQIPLTAEGHIHVCGPLPFMRHIRSGLLRRGVPSERIAVEVFGPDLLRTQPA